MSATSGSRFYLGMGVVMTLLVISGFGMAAIGRGLNPAELPLLFHLHGVTYLLWCGLFVTQASLIGRQHVSVHRKLGTISPVIVIAMLVTGWLMAKGSYARGISPIPDMSVEQFMSFPFADLVSLALFYGLAIGGRKNALFHKHAMLLAFIVIMDPPTARLGMSIGFPPFPLLACAALVGALLWHDRKVHQSIHLVTWLGVAWLIFRPVFVFGIAGSEAWAGFATTLFS